jgi:hypothetical protein
MVGSSFGAMHCPEGLLIATAPGSDPLLDFGMRNAFAAIQRGHGFSDAGDLPLIVVDELRERFGREKRSAAASTLGQLVQPLLDCGINANGDGCRGHIVHRPVIDCVHLSTDCAEYKRSAEPIPPPTEWLGLRDRNAPNTEAVPWRFVTRGRRQFGNSVSCSLCREAPALFCRARTNSHLDRLLRRATSCGSHQCPVSTNEVAPPCMIA